MADAGPRGIYVLAGTNGAGKSSVAGRAITGAGGEFFNPDDVTKRLRDEDPSLGLEEANSLAWQTMRSLLNRAIDDRRTFVFETTLGGRSITAALQRATAEGVDVRIWYVGLRTPEDHIRRVQSRVAAGGHDIPEDKIRQRFDDSRLHLIELLPGLRELWVYDNSAPGSPPAVSALLVLHMIDGVVVESCPLGDVPEWAKPILVTALQI